VLASHTQKREYVCLIEPNKSTKNYYYFTNTHKHTQTHTNTHKHTHTHTHTYTHTHTHTERERQGESHTHIQTHTDARIRSTHTRTHTHTQDARHARKEYNAVWCDRLRDMLYSMNLQVAFSTNLLHVHGCQFEKR
jgi:hypothetical protein